MSHAKETHHAHEHATAHAPTHAPAHAHAKRSVILVTGGSGLVGKAIESIIREEHNDKESWIFASSKDGDLRDKEQTKAMFEKYKPTHCIHVRISSFLVPLTRYV